MMAQHDPTLAVVGGARGDLRVVGGGFLLRRPVYCKAGVGGGFSLICPRA